MNSEAVGLEVTWGPHACAGIFFVGYTVGQIPSNLCLNAIGAPWLTMILMAWGITSALGCLINSPNGYIAQRLLLGIVESGTFPGMPIPSAPHIQVSGHNAVTMVFTEHAFNHLCFYHAGGSLGLMLDLCRPVVPHHTIFQLK